jgi:tetratricopeptide (TPR) repeat protein
MNLALKIAIGNTRRAAGRSGDHPPAPSAGRRTGETDLRHARWGARTVIAPQHVSPARRAMHPHVLDAAVVLLLGAGVGLALSAPGDQMPQAMIPTPRAEPQIARYVPPPETIIEAAPGPSTASVPVAVQQSASRTPAFRIARGAQVQAQTVTNAAGHFAQGRAHARAGDWTAAHRAFARAVELDARPDHVFNLAVSLEHLGRSADALGHYRAALTIARQRPAGFDPRVALERVAVLAVSPGAAP